MTIDHHHCPQHYLPPAACSISFASFLLVDHTLSTAKNSSLRPVVDIMFHPNPGLNHLLSVIANSPIEQEPPTTSLRGWQVSISEDDDLSSSDDDSDVPDFMDPGTSSDEDNKSTSSDEDDESQIPKLVRRGDQSSDDESLPDWCYNTCSTGNDGSVAEPENTQDTSNDADVNNSSSNNKGDGEKHDNDNNNDDNDNKNNDGDDDNNKDDEDNDNNKDDDDKKNNDGDDDNNKDAEDKDDNNNNNDDNDDDKDDDDKDKDSNNNDKNDSDKSCVDWRREKEEAESLYSGLLSAIGVATAQEHPLRKADCKIAARRRALLMGREGSEASWEEFINVRLITDVMGKSGLSVKQDPDNPDECLFQCASEIEYLQDLDPVRALTDAANYLLETYPEPVQRVWKSDKKKGVVLEKLPRDKALAMYGLSRSWKGNNEKQRIEVFGPKHTIEFRRRVIEHGYAHAMLNVAPGGIHRLTVKDIKDVAYKNARENPQDDLNRLMSGEEFKAGVKERLEADFLGTRSSPVDSEIELPFHLAMEEQYQQSHPVVEFEEFALEDSDRKILYGVVHNPISKSDLLCLHKYLQNTRFLKGSRGKSKSFVRVISSREGDGGPPFVVAGKTLYPCASECGPDELQIIGYANSIMRTLRTVMKEMYPHHAITDTCWTNVAQMLVGRLNDATYGAHNDEEATICITAKEDCIEVMPNAFLPTQDNMIVITYCLTNHSEPGAMVLRIINKDTDKTVGEVKLSNHCIHIQLPYCNNKVVMHHPRSADKHTGGGVWRLTITFRLQVDGRCDKEAAAF